MGYAVPRVVERRIVASNDLLHSHDAENSVTGYWLELHKEITIEVPMVNSVLRFKCKFKGTNTHSCMAFYKNGHLEAGGIGVWVNTTTNYIEKSADIAGWEKGDVFTVRAYCPSPSHESWTKELRVYGVVSNFDNSY